MRIIHTIIAILLLSLIPFKSNSNTITDIKNLKAKKYISKQSVFPEPIGIVNDYSDVLTEFQEKRLETIVADFQKKTSNQISIIMIDSIKPYTDVQKYASDIGNEWGVGQKGKENGLVIVLCLPLGEIGIATGFGTERVLTSEICGTIVAHTIIPEFEKGNIYEGLMKGTVALINKWK